MSDRTYTPTPSKNVLSRTKLSRFVAGGFLEPTDEVVSRLEDRAIVDDVFEAAQDLDLAANRLRIFSSPPESAAELRESHGRILGHTVRSDCPPYELEYRGAEIFQQSQTLADISGFYRAFGFDVLGAMSERADHVAAQWEFLSVLAMMEYLAKTPDEIQCCVNAQREFLKEHASSWMPAFFERIRRLEPDSYLARLADLAEAVLCEWCAAFGIQTGPKWLELREIEDEDSSITCGAPGAVELGPTLASAMEERN